LDVKPGTSPRVIHVTGPDYEDTVLLSPTPFRTEGEGYRFHGRAGVVRRTSGGLNKALLDGEELALT
jgi:hypothetical protein